MLIEIVNTVSVIRGGAGAKSHYVYYEVGLGDSGLLKPLS